MNKPEKNENYNNKTFEDIKHIDENGIEFWYARELMNCLNYSKWSNFKKVISKAMESCKIVIYQCLTILPTSAKWYK